MLFLLGFQAESFGQNKFTVVLDAGHGGKDPGRPAKNYSEKDIALSIVLKLGKKLKDLNDINSVVLILILYAVSNIRIPD